MVHTALERLFRLKENGTTVRTELLAGATTFLTMAYIIFVQPAVLSGVMFGQPTGMDFGAVTTATCLAAALASAIMGLYARYPIAQAPGMGENFFFVFTAVPDGGSGRLARCRGHWQLGAVFISGVLFLVLSLVGVARGGDECDQPEHAARDRRGHRAVHCVHRAAERRTDRQGSRHGGAPQPALRLAGPDRVLRRAAGRRRTARTARARGRSCGASSRPGRWPSR